LKKIKFKEVRKMSDFKEKEKIGLKRHFTQIYDTITFELKRTWKSFIMLLIVYFGIFLLFVILNELEEVQAVEPPEKAIDYIGGYLGMLGLLIIISTSTLGAAIIVEDFQKQTGNLLFPKISKSRLLVGRIVSRYSLNAILIIFYYILVASITNYKYQEIPDTLRESMGWALLYTFMIFSFVIFMSSISKNKATAIIVSILLLLIAFNIINSILMFTKTGIEPLFLLTYYENIITASLDMPDPRYETVSFGRPDETEDQPEFKRWLTPSASGALTGMIIFSVLLLVAAFLLYKMRQSKNE
jgi:ABC-type transport system involved in multi-copper enzyme maturation permease subunit